MGKILPWILLIGGGIVSAIGEGLMTMGSKDEVVSEIKEDYVLVEKPKKDN